MVAEAPTLTEILPAVSAAIEGCRVVIYNAAFDVQFFPNPLFRESQVECAMRRYAERKGEWNSNDGNYRWHKLHVAAKATGFTRSGAVAPGAGRHTGMPACLAPFGSLSSG